MLLTNCLIHQILIDVKSYLQKQPSLVDIKVPDENKFTVCGDIHGQYYDLMNIFKLNGLPSEANPYLFNGDFVDRGSFSVECIFTLFSFKLLFPDHFYMSRGEICLLIFSTQLLFLSRDFLNLLVVYGPVIKNNLNVINAEFNSSVLVCNPL